MEAQRQQQLRPSYPTNSLSSLRQREQGSAVLDILIVGAGLGGLAAAIALTRQGHTVQVLEQATRLGEVGAGIQVPPNSLRILQAWGIDRYMSHRVVEPDAIYMRRWEDGAPIGLTQLVPDFRNAYAAPYFVVHRADLHSALHQLAVDSGVRIRTGARVASYDAEIPRVKLSSGETLAADLIVAADGIKSSARGLLCPEQMPKSKPMATGFAVYRATVPVDSIKSDPCISWLMDKSNINLWVGPGKHVMTYSIASGKTFNLVLSHKDDSDERTYSDRTSQENLSDMRKHFNAWDPTLVKLIGKIDHTTKWPLNIVPTLSKWVSASGKLVVIGDAAHAMLPYMSQGAAMAVEDAAALGMALSDIDSVASIPSRLELFERVRRERCGAMQEASAVNGVLWHFEDGPEQRSRDAAMMDEVFRRPIIASANQWTDAVTQRWTYGYDATWEVQQGLALGARCQSGRADN